jgi:hypothetical protein
MPPLPPNNSIEGIVEFMQSPNLLMASTIYILMWGAYMAIAVGSVYLNQIRRMSVSPAFRYTFMISMIAAGILGSLFPMFCFGVASFRDGYSPEVYAMLYDFGYLAYIGSLGCFCAPWMCFALAIILDTKNVLPKWVGYYTAWQYVSELMVAGVWIYKDGPFAWDGLLAFWFAMLVFVPWQFIIYVYIYKAIKNQPEEELDSFRFQRPAHS